MEQREITMQVQVSEDETDTIVRCELDLRGEHFEATGRARRNPVDPPRPLIGEELALARALALLQHDIMEAAQDRITKFLVDG